MRAFSSIDGNVPTFRPSDFDNDKYTGISCCQMKNGMPVVLMASRSSDPPHFIVAYGNNISYFLSYREAEKCLQNARRLSPSR